MPVEQAFARLLRVAEVRWPDWQTEARAAQTLRRALSRLLRGERRDREAALAFHAYVLRGRPLPETGREKQRRLLSRALRRLYGFPEIRRTLAQAQIVRRRGMFARPASGWIRLDEAVGLTGYSRDGLRAVLRRRSEIRRVKWRGRLYVRKKEILSYARRQSRRGYGPQEYLRR